MAGIAIARLRAEFDAILYSPKVRAAGTAELAAESFSAEQRALLEVHPPLAGDFGAREALAALNSAAAVEGRVLLVGHEPDMSRVAGELTGGRVDVKKGGLVVLRLDGPSAELAIR